jgi:hypothetical protein
MTDKSDRPEISTDQMTRRELMLAGAAVAGIASAEALGGIEAPQKGEGGASGQRGAGCQFSSNQRTFMRRGQAFDATNAEFFEGPLEDPTYLEVWCYTDKLSYLPGEEVRIHTSSTGSQISLEIIRDGLKPESVHRVEDLPAQMHRLPKTFYETGCQWPIGYTWRIPEDLPSGFYLVIARTSTNRFSETDRSFDGVQKTEVREQEHGFFVRRPTARKRADILFVSSTCTWNAYNDWNGFSHYVGYDLPDKFRHAPRLSIHRPFARGIVRSPIGSPRKPHALPITTNSVPVYPVIDFAFSHGYSKWFTNCGWATYERPFVVFAEENSVKLDYATQLDLHYDPQLLDGYRCVVIVGHCEYWTWEMREAIDRFVEAGGNVARFAGNFCWQIRLEDGGRTQIAYKGRAHDSDPLRNTEQSRRLTTYWEDPAVNWPGAETFGLCALYGVYAHVGVNVPRGTGGFTVYRPDHWAFAGTDLYFGDEFGADAKIFGYEVDGLDHTFRDGLPYPTARSGAPEGTEILAMALASNREVDHGNRGSVFYYGDGSEEIAKLRYGKVNAETKEAASRGNGMIVTFKRGKGTVFHAGSSEWVSGLLHRDFCTEAITRNVLKRFTQAS